VPKELEEFLDTPFPCLIGLDRDNGEALEGVSLYLDRDQVQIYKDKPIPELPSNENTRIDKLLSSNPDIILFRNSFLECLYSFIKKLDPFIINPISTHDLESSFNFQAYLLHTNSNKPNNFIFTFVRT
jgi:hypothetical protein